MVALPCLDFTDASALNAMNNKHAAHLQSLLLNLFQPKQGPGAICFQAWKGLFVYSAPCPNFNQRLKAKGFLRRM